MKLKVIYLFFSYNNESVYENCVLKTPFFVEFLNQKFEEEGEGGSRVERHAGRGQHPLAFTRVYK
jgi:hypothetical protein